MMLRLACRRFSTSMTLRNKVLALESLNPLVRNAEYAVRGELAIRADKYKQDLAAGKKLNFDEIVYCNIGNPQQLGQKPISFFRQVSALLEVPDLLEPSKRSDVLKLFPADAIKRATTLKENIGSVGAYSHSQGIPFIRKNIAKFIEERDGFPSDPENIFLTAGASEGVKACLSIMMQHDNVGVLIPNPQYPLYSASMTLFNGKGVSYALNEDDDWSLSVPDLKKSVQESRAKGVDVRALVVINPGNPTGQCLSPENMKEIVQFCANERIVLLADEVYQTNVYASDRKFHSFKKIVASMNIPDFEMISFHSISKGMVGECGRRGGYFELFGIDSAVKEQIYKIASISLCPSVQGQVMVDLMVNPPKKGDESFESYNKEVTAIYESLKRRAEKLVQAFRKMEGVTCNSSQGAMYAFPQIRLPPAAVAAAKASGKQPDTFYCLAMLDATGVCVVPGSGFGQKEGTYHFRATFLPPEEKFDQFIQRIGKFHQEFLDKYRS